MMYLKQSTAVTVKIGPFLDESDGKTVEDALTISQADVRLSKNGGDMAQKNDATACTHDELGMYNCPLNATDTDTLGRLKLNVHESGALPIWENYMVIPANVYDSLFGSDRLQVDVREKGDSALDFTSTEKASINTEVDNALDTAIPGSPTANSINERVAAIDDKLPSGTISDFDESSDSVNLVADQSGVTVGTVNALGTQAKADVNVEADTALTDYDPPTKAELDSGLAGLNDLSAAEVNAEVDTALTDYDPPTKTEMDSGFAGLNDLSAAEVNTQVDAAIEDYRLDELMVAALSAQPTAESLLADLTEDDGGTQRFTQNALEQAPTGGTNPNVLVSTTILSVTSQTEFTLSAGSNDDDAYNDQAIVLYDASDSDYPSVRKVSNYVGATKTVTIDSAPDFTIVSGDGVKIFVTAPGTTAPTAAENADAVWDEAKGDHVGAGSFGEEVQSHATPAEVDTECDEALTNYDPPTKAEMDTGFGALNDLSTAEVNAEVDAALSDYDPPTKTEMDNGFAGLNDPTAAQVADAVWDEPIADHTTSTTFGAKNQKVVPSETIGDYKADVSSLALEATLTAIKGTGWTDENIKEIVDLLENATYGLSALKALIDALNDLAASEVWAYTTRTLTDPDSYKADVSNLDVAVSTRSDFDESTDSVTLTAAGIDAILDDPIEGTITLRQVLRIFLSALAGKSVGGGTTTITFRDNADSKDRITATVDSNGNRTAVTLDAS